MLSTFENVLSTTTVSGISVVSFLICIGMALVYGLLISLAFNFKKEVSKSFSITLCLLTPAVALVILMVNGSIGAGIAVAGSFSLIRFRSVPGTGREIVGIFLAMVSGIAAGMGYVGLGLIFTLCIIFALLVLENFVYKEKTNQNKKTLRVTIPEDLEYEDIFSDLLEKYCSKSELVTVKTVNLGSLLKLNFNVELKNDIKQKDLIDAIRIRNGNLEISLSLQTTQEGAL